MMSASSLFSAVFETGLDADAHYAAMLIEADFRMGRRVKEMHDQPFHWNFERAPERKAGTARSALAVIWTEPTQEAGSSSSRLK